MIFRGIVRSRLCVEEHKDDKNGNGGYAHDFPLSRGEHGHCHETSRLSTKDM